MNFKAGQQGCRAKGKFGKQKRSDFILILMHLFMGSNDDQEAARGQSHPKSRNDERAK